MNCLPEYRVDIRVKNNWLLRRMQEKGMNTGADLARAAGITITQACALIGMRAAPLGRNGQITRSAMKVCEALDAGLGELWPPEHLLDPMPSNRASVEMTKADVGVLIGHDHEPSPEALLMEREPIEKAMAVILDTLPERERNVIVRRFGLEGHEEETLEQIAKRMGVIRERIRQIEAKALRRARSRMEKQQRSLVRALGFSPRQVESEVAP